MLDIREFERQKNITCSVCKFRFGLKLLDGKSTIEEFGGCPSCYLKMVKKKRMSPKEAMEKNRAVELHESFEVAPEMRIYKGIEV